MDPVFRIIGTTGRAGWPDTVSPGQYAALRNYADASMARTGTWSGMVGDFGRLLG
ncbi:MAG: hypothetical protein N0E48_06740 [Candidatus Thiodiazotropha endolucinida]|nr:hypothetical protein [Candidatus Thiodiazotropha endolucinida]